MLRKFKQKDGTEIEIDLDDSELESLVDSKSHKKAIDDMMRYKKEAKDFSAQLEAEKISRTAIEQAQLEEKGEFKSLYEKNELEKIKLAQEVKDQGERFLNFHLRNQVIEKLGGLKNPAYNSFIKVENLVVENGAATAESVQAEVDRIKQELPEIIKLSGVKIPNSQSPKGPTETELDLSKMSLPEQNAAIKAALMEMEHNKK